MINEDKIKVTSMSLGNLNSEIGWLDIRVDRSTDLGNPFEIPKNCEHLLDSKYHLSGFIFAKIRTNKYIFSN